MKVIVAGAGVAGLTLAARLGVAGWKVVLVEPGARIGEKSYIVDLFGDGYAAAERMGLTSRLSELQYRFPEVVWVDERGAPVARLDRLRFERMLGGRVLTLMRGDLEAALHDSLPRAVDVRFDCRIEEIQLPGAGVASASGRGRWKTRTSSSARTACIHGYAT